MRLLVASDIHGSPESLRFLLEKTEALRPDRVILLGDLLYHGPRNFLPRGYDPMPMPEGFRKLMDLCPVTCVRGNCDAEVDLYVLPFAMPEGAWIVDGPLTILACHGHRIPENPPLPVERGVVVLRGHTHVPRAETLDGWTFWNPGSLTLPKGGSPRSWAMVEEGVFRVYDTKGNLVLEHAAPGAAR